jgi:hypothetical protein
VLVLEIKVNRADRILGFGRNLFNGGGIETVDGKNPLGGGQNVLRPLRFLAFAASACGLNFM